MFCRTAYLVVVQVDLRADKPVGLLDAEQKPGVYLYTTVAVLAGTVTPLVIFVGRIAHAVEVLLRVFVSELSEDAEAVVLEKQLGLYLDIQSAFEDECHGKGEY